MSGWWWLLLSFKRIMDASLTLPFLSTIFLPLLFFRGGLERRKKYGFPNRKEIWTVVTFPINWPGVFCRTPPPFWNKARKSRLLCFKLYCILSAVGTIQTFYQQHQKHCCKGIFYSSCCLLIFQPMQPLPTRAIIVRVRSRCLFDILIFIIS